MNPIEPTTESGKRLKAITMDDSNETLTKEERDQHNYCPSHGAFDRKLTRILTSLPFLADEVSHTRESIQQVERLVRTGLQDMERRANEKFDAQDKRLEGQDRLISAQKSEIKILTFKLGSLIGGIGILGFFLLNKLWDFISSLIQTST